MPRQAWSDKRERQYEHVQESVPRTVDKERARTGEARESSRLSRADTSSGPRGGTKAQLLQRAVDRRK